MARIEVTGEPGTGDQDPDPAAELLAGLDDVLGELADEARECDPDDGWYPDTAHLDYLLDEVEDLAAGTPDVARELAGHVIERIRSVLAAGNCLSGDLADALARAEELHRGRLSRPDPTAAAASALPAIPQNLQQ
jgi:hypothetical protein